MTDAARERFIEWMKQHRPGFGEPVKVKAEKIVPPPVRREVVCVEFIPLKTGHRIGVREAIDARPDLPPLLALAATHRTIGQVTGLRKPS